MEALLGKSLSELQSIALQAGLPKFAGKQLAQWLYLRRVMSIDDMTNISLKGREALKQSYVVGRHEPVAQAVSKDGTRKYLFAVHLDPASLSAPSATPSSCPVLGPTNPTSSLDPHVQTAPANAQNNTLTSNNNTQNTTTPTQTTSKSSSVPLYIESVYIPDADRATLCVSTQAGCKMGCRFCMTGTLGFHGHLPASEILNQIFYFSDLTNVVYMGEGEPMDNVDAVLRSLEVLTADWGCAWSGKRITVSSVGHPNLSRLLNESDCHVAISLHNPFTAERRDIMPAERLFSLSEVVSLLRTYDWSHQRRISFEYICWHGKNDSIKHANELLRLLRGLPCRINLIRFHASPSSSTSSPFPPSDEQQMIWFRDYLTDHGITTTIRRSRGEDILAACGMLVNALQNQ